MNTFIFPLFCFLLLGSCSFSKSESSPQEPTQITQETIKEVQKTEESSKITPSFLGRNFQTDTSKISIDASKILDGGPGKDGIPSIDSPKFLSIGEAKKTMQYLTGEKDGITVIGKNEARFYPFDILVWHEIVNDTIDNTPIAITFCPLCGSSIVYERRLDDITLEFGVSGKLYESNMLMYDRTTESLWSQSLGESVVGDFLGKKLTHYPFQKMNFETFEKKYPQGKVLSDETGHRRNYGVIPYGDYDTNNDTYFPVSFEDTRYNIKELFYIVPYKGESYAFHYGDIREKGQAQLGDIELFYQDKQLRAKDTIGNEIPGYFEMWFSWRTHHKNSENFWSQDL